MRSPLFLGLVLGILFSWEGIIPPATGQEPADSAKTATSTAPDATRPTDAARAETPGEHYGAWVLLPPLLTIVLAIILRQVLPALFIGVLVAAGMLAWWQTTGQVGSAAVQTLTLAVEHFVIGAFIDADHAKIITFTLLIGGMVGVIAANGGTPAVVNAVARWASNRRRGQLVTWLAGLIVFFDDYANAMIVGPSMRPVCDRLRISRAKLAYLVDSTAAPVSSIALIGTWVGAEVDFIYSGLKSLGASPHFLPGIPLDEGFAYGTFLKSIPYRFYPILALVLGFFIGWFDRDFGPMRRAESRREGAVTARGTVAEPAAPTRAWYAGVPVLILVLVTLGLLGLTGWNALTPQARSAGGLALVQHVVSNGDAYNSILYGALAALTSAVLISLGTRTLSLADTVEGATAGMTRMFTTLMVLVLAWALSSAMQELQLGEVARGLLVAARFDATWLPLLVFATACVVSFATGTSWGTMGILCPATVSIAAGLLADRPADEALPLFYAAVGAVLAGAVFGDHCSPISDTTVLSALASECTLEAHVWTQMPYALTVAGVSILCGDVLCRYLQQPWWFGLLTGTLLLLLIVLLVGRRPIPLETASPTEQTKGTPP